MGEHLIKPYEISVWEDKLTPIEGSNPVEYKLEETKLAVIGSDTMTGLNKVYDPVFNKKTNGEKTLTFSLKYKYFDPYSGNSDFVNPFARLLVNERKVKLHYDNEWYEFIIKDHTESRDELTWTYTCTDAFVLELSKNGYNLTFDAELNNNQDTASNLAKVVLENTDWQYGESGDIFKQLIAEPIYVANLLNTSGVDIINANTGAIATLDDNTQIYVFYSYVKNRDGKFVQFIIKQDDALYTIDDNNVITATNYRIKNELVYNEEECEFILRRPNETDVTIIDLGAIENQYQANRLAYNQLTTYDPVMERTVDRFSITNGQGEETGEVYRYTDYEYTTSNVVMNYITNGENFNALEDGTLQGWNPYTDQSGNAKVEKLELTTYPELATGKSLANLNTLSQVEGYLGVRFTAAMEKSGGKIYNTIYNSGIENNASFIHSISKGDKFVFRWRAGKGTLGNLSTVGTLGLIVAKYDQDEPTRYGYYYKHIKEEDIILHFEGKNENQVANLPIANNIITGGSIDNNQYIIDSVVQIPSTKYIYEDGARNNNQYVWNATASRFDELTNSNYLPYYYLIAEARESIPNTILSDPTADIGIFVYSTQVTKTNNKIDPIYIQDIQLTRFVQDGSYNEEHPILIGNVPTATAQPIEYYYVKPKEGTDAEDVETYISISKLAERLGINEEQIVAKYNENSEKTLSISASQSNCFDILQTIAETFECWIDLVVEHDERGYVTYTDNKPNKFVYLREYVGRDNWAGFKYGINLESIEREVNSDEIVTKLIVDQAQSDYVDEGFVSIASASSNTSGEAYILNFDYYYNQGLLNRIEAETDKNQFIAAVADLNRQIQAKEKERIDLETSLTALGSKRNVYTELVDTAQETLSETLDEFEELTSETYSEYCEKHGGLIIPTGSETQDNKNKNDQLTEEETILGIIGTLYACSSTINSYSGLLTNLDKEYWNIRRQLRGVEDYSVKFWKAQDSNQQWHVFVDFNDYLAGAKFKLGTGNDTTNWSEYEVTVSRKYFDLTTDSTGILFIAPTGYTVTSTPTTITTSPETIEINSTSTEARGGVEKAIKDIQESKDALTNAFNNKYRRFIQEGTWSSTEYIDSELYYLDALQVSNTSAQPQVSYTINVVEVSELEGLELYKFDAGDKTYVEDTEFFGWSNVGGILTPAREEVIVSEVEWHLDEPENNVITVQNYKTRFEDLFQRISATVQTVQYNEATYAKMSTLLDANGTLNENVLLNSLNKISGQKYTLTTDGSIVINGNEILIQNLTNRTNRVIINNEGISVSADGGDNWTKVIDGFGINADAVIAGEINTKQVIIGSKDNPSFRWDVSGISAYKSYLTTDQGGQEIERYDLKTYVRYDQYGLYGIKNNSTFKAQSLQDVLDKAHFAVTWDGFFIKNSYTGGGRVEITSDNDFRVLKTVNNEEKEVIKIGALEWNGSTTPIEGVAPTLYGIRITNDQDIETFKTGNDGNITITGIINATGGNFSDLVTVGKDDDDNSKPYIEIDGRDNQDATIRSSLYTQDGASYGWMINAAGDAVFNNITARGAIKTAVFEYAEIQAVGGIFIFRPSSTIKAASRVGQTDDISVTLEKPHLFKVGDWCKISNYTNEEGEPIATAILSGNGLTHVYKVKSIDSNNTRILVLENAYSALVSGQYKVVESLNDLIGGALVDMGNKDNGDGEVGSNNYGIGVNSSDNVVNLPARAISLFETIVDENHYPKVRYNYRGILGTLPVLSYSGANPQVSELYHNNLEGTQGIYTDNMYLGDNNQYLTFYTDKVTGEKKLKIKASQIVYEVYDPDTHQPTGDWNDVNETAGVPGPPGDPAIRVAVESSAGDIFRNRDINSVLTCTVYAGMEDITDQVTRFTWQKKNGDGTIDTSWSRLAAGRSITIGPNDIDSKAIFICTVEF